MSKLTPKKMEMHQRELRILELARKMVLRGGYHGLSLDSLASELGISRGTIYNHFQCKEEIILALLVETMEKRRDMFGRAAAFRGIPRERLAAVGMAAELFVRLYPDHFRMEQIVKSDSIWDKTSEERRSLVKSCQMQCVGIVAGVVRDGMAQGQVTLPEGMSPEALVFGLWSMTEGAYSIIATSDAVMDLGIGNPFVAIRQNIQSLVDGFHWLPLSPDLDLKTVSERVREEIFSREFSELKQEW
jgi:AcrR family transcriptional regulator